MSTDTLFDLEPEPRLEPNAPARFRAVARKDDPITSHHAAASVRDVTVTHQHVLDILADCGELTDDQIATEYLRRIGTQGWTPVSPSGLRSRRAELVDLNKVVDTGKRGRSPSNRPCVIWALAPVYNSAKPVN